MWGLGRPLASPRCFPPRHAKGGAVEFHLYESGGHGFGDPGRKGVTRTQGPTVLAWMRARGLLDAKR